MMALLSYTDLKCCTLNMSSFVRVCCLHNAVSQIKENLMNTSGVAL